MFFKDKNISDNDRYMKTEVTIIGFGNKYRSDDGIGIRVIEELKKLDSFKEVEVIDGGTSGTDLLFLAKECKKIIIIDAIDIGKDAGQVVCIKASDIEEFIKGDYKSLSLHDLNLCDVLKIIRELKIDTEILIIGVKPENIGFGESLTPEIEKKIPGIITRIKKEINL